MQPRLSELFADFLRRRISEPPVPQAVVESEVEPHQAATLVVLDVRQSLNDATAAADWLLTKEDATAFHAIQMPPGWAHLVRNQESIVAIPFCVGNYPQMLRDVAPLLSGNVQTALAAQIAQAPTMTDVSAWGDSMLQRGKWAESLFAAAVLRSGGQQKEAAELLGRIAKLAPKSCEPLCRNEHAALAWCAGDRKRAGQLWDAHPQCECPPILFNRGLAAIVGGKFQEADKLLRQTVAKLSDESAWRHLAQLYLTLIKSR